MEQLTKSNSKDFSIGVDLGGTNLRIAAYSPAHGIFDSISIPTRLDAGPHGVIDDLVRGVRDLIDRFAAEYDLAGIGVGTPGPLELPAGRIHNPPNLPGWDGFQLRAALESRLGREIAMGRDANLAALAEYRLGLGRQLRIGSLCMLTLGTGVGGGIVLNGQLWEGANGMSGEGGHVIVHHDGPKCGCGSSGCLEQYASGTAIARLARERLQTGSAPGLRTLNGQNPAFTGEDVYHLACSGSPDALEVFSRMGVALGIGLASMINTLNLPLYVLGGGLVSAWKFFSPSMFDEVRRRSYVFRITELDRSDSIIPEAVRTRIMPAALGAEAGLLGACLLALPQDDLQFERFAEEREVRSLERPQAF